MKPSGLWRVILSIQVTGKFWGKRPEGLSAVEVAYKCGRDLPNIAAYLQWPKKRKANERPRENCKPQLLNWNPLHTKTMIKQFSKVDFYKIGDPLLCQPPFSFPNFCAVDLVRKSLVTLEKVATIPGRENGVNSCHVCGCHRFSAPPSRNIRDGVCPVAL